MKRKFLYEIIDEIAEAENFQEELYKKMDLYKWFKRLLYILYNKDYNWEADKSIFNAEARSKRDNGGFPAAWVDVVILVENKLVKTTILSSRFMDSYYKACRSCNKKDVDILNYALSHRNLPGYKGGKKKIIMNAIKEYFGDEYQTV